jgi:hypothetical protein
MDDISKFFNEDPWKFLGNDEYPKSTLLYEQDTLRRYWVSQNQDGQLIFFIKVDGAHNLSLPKLGNLALEMIINGNETRVLFTLEDLALKDKFSTVIKDVAHTTSALSGERLLKGVIKTMKTWSIFLKPTREGLTDSELIGFWGEMEIFTNHIRKFLDAEAAIESWIGPEDKKQDFTFNRSAVEIKTSMSGNPSDLKINSIDQLHRITDHLYLINVLINGANEVHGTSLQELHDKAIKDMKGNILAITKFKLKTSKFFGKATSDQLNKKFIYLSHKTYAVDSNFPTITPLNINHIGIIGAEYKISIASIIEFEFSKSIGEIINE